ncbi:MAG: glycosyltransferase [Actinomycetota bacterium]|nr:glycosyltransferase [Actinomycetota bacterium]
MPTGDIALCSLEAWDDVWRRNQLFVKHLLDTDPHLRVLFVEPPVDVLLELANGRRPGKVGLRQVTADGRLWALRPRKVLPRLVGRGTVDRGLARSVRAAVTKLTLRNPLLWVNDVTYAGLAEEDPWPVVYDITDDWLLAGGSKRTLKRLQACETKLLKRADEVVVVSRSLVTSKGRQRDVHLIGSGVDLEHFRKPRARPADLPPPPIAVYIGTQHDIRLDVDLCTATAQAISPAKLVFVGPNCLKHESTRRLRGAGCTLLGPRPYDDTPAYYQHANVIVVPHRVNPFTESLDPIKGYECLAVGSPTVSTPVAGIRDLGPPIQLAPPGEFPSLVAQLLAERRPTRPGQPPTWAERSDAFAGVLRSARRKRSVPSTI